MSQDRMGIHFAAKEISRLMSKPEEQHWRSPNSLARHLKHNKSIVLEHTLQGLLEKVVVWPDADFAGHKRTRTSTSGGVVVFGNHYVKT